MSIATSSVPDNACKSERDEAALAHAADHRALNSEVVEQGREVIRRVPVAERLRRRHCAAVTALVPRDDAVAVGERLDLVIEHIAVHQEAVAQDKWHARSAGVGVVQPLAADLGNRHRASLICLVYMQEPNFADVLGAEVVLAGERYDDARANAEKLAREHGYRYIHSGDEPLLIAGVGTHTLEVLQELPHIDTVIVPIGGGSGAAGACIVAKAVNPDIQVIGVQSNQAQAAYLSWKSGKLQESPNRTRAEGLSTATPFELPQRIMRRLLDDFVLVSDDEIDAATALMIEKTRTMVEAAGAAALAAALKLRDRMRGRTIALICSGGNISPAQLKALLTGPVIG